MNSALSSPDSITTRIPLVSYASIYFFRKIFHGFTYLVALIAVPLKSSRGHFMFQACSEIYSWACVTCMFRDTWRMWRTAFKWYLSWIDFRYCMLLPRSCCLRRHHAVLDVRTLGSGGLSWLSCLSISLSGQEWNLSRQSDWSTV
jgi:hypothetical protein